MYEHIENIEDIYKTKNIFIWLVSTFKAGFINSAGFLSSGEFVSHVTGFGTRIGIAIGHEEYFFGLELLIIPVSFIFGGVVTSLILDKEYKKHEIPPYYKVQALVTFLIGAVIILGESELISPQEQFGADEKYNWAEFLMIFLLVFICGLKNSLITWATKGKIRVTHMTGNSTDIGLHLIRTLGFRQPNPRFKEPKSANIVRIFTLVCFSTGALISAFLFPMIGYNGFYIVLLISAFLSIQAYTRWRMNEEIGIKSNT